MTIFVLMFEPVQLNLPSYPFRIKQEDDVRYIFDEIRKKFLVLTPEEWVRQHFVQFIIREKGYPRSLIRLEGGLKVNTLKRRTDIVAFSSAGEKILMVECKAPHIPISQKVFDQIARYNITHRIPLLAVSNGISHYFCLIDFSTKSYRFIENLPSYSDTNSF